MMVFVFSKWYGSSICIYIYIASAPPPVAQTSVPSLSMEMPKEVLDLMCDFSPVGRNNPMRFTNKNCNRRCLRSMLKLCRGYLDYICHPCNQGGK